MTKGTWLDRGAAQTIGGERRNIDVGPAKGPRVATVVRDEDAKVVIAAPDLLEALKGMVRAWERFGPGPLMTLNGAPSSYDKAVAAIAKAEGRS